MITYDDINDQIRAYKKTGKKEDLVLALQALAEGIVCQGSRIMESSKITADDMSDPKRNGEWRKGG